METSLPKTAKELKLIVSQLDQVILKEAIAKARENISGVPGRG